MSRSFGDAVNEYKSEQAAKEQARQEFNSTLRFGGDQSNYYAYLPAQYQWADVPGKPGLQRQQPFDHSKVGLSALPQYQAPQVPYQQPQAANNIFGANLQQYWSPATMNYSLRGPLQAKGGGGYMIPQSSLIGAPNPTPTTPTAPRQVTPGGQTSNRRNGR